MKCIDILMEEHQIILNKLSELEENLSQETTIDKMRKAIDFIQNYADHFHHLKEEDILFKWMIEKNPMFAHGGPIQVMLSEHEMGRSFIRNANDELEKYESDQARGLQGVKENLMMFVNLLRDHIHKEDNILYMMARQLDDGTGDATMLPLFEKIKQEEFQKIEHLL